MSKSADAFETFGYPIHLNGEEMLFWFNGTASAENAKHANFYEFGVTDVQKKEAERSSAKAASASTEPLSASEAVLGDILSRVKNKNVVNVEKVENSEKPNLRVEDEQSQGMVKDGVTHFSVAGMRAWTAGANMEASYIDPADGKRKFVIPVKGARLQGRLCMQRGRFKSA